MCVKSQPPHLTHIKNSPEHGKFNYLQVCRRKAPWKIILFIPCVCVWKISKCLYIFSTFVIWGFYWCSGRFNISVYLCKQACTLKEKQILHNAWFAPSFVCLRVCLHWPSVHVCQVAGDASVKLHNVWNKLSASCPGQWCVCVCEVEEEVSQLCLTSIFWFLYKHSCSDFNLFIYWFTSANLAATLSKFALIIKNVSISLLSSCVVPRKQIFCLIDKEKWCSLFLSCLLVIQILKCIPFIFEITLEVTL